MNRFSRERAFLLIAGLGLSSLFALTSSSEARVEYAAFSGSNCMACHVGPTGGFGRRPASPDDTGSITDKFFMSGDFQFLVLWDQRDPAKDRTVMFPMEGALHFGFTPKETVTIAASQDFGILREAWAMVHNPQQTMYIRAGYFSLPYGWQFADHTAFVREGRVETGPRAFEELGTGAELFSVRYKDSGVEAGLSGKPWFVNVAMTAGVLGQEERTFPSAQSGSKRAMTRRAGFITRHVSLGVSNYTNDNETLDRRILRYGAFGWVRAGPVALIFEHDEGEEEQFNVAGSTQLSASYAELIYGFPFTEKRWPSYAKVRWERLDPNRSVSGASYQRWVGSFRFAPVSYATVETVYRKNLEKPTDRSNDDVFVISHFFF